MRGLPLSHPGPWRRAARWAVVLLSLAASLAPAARGAEAAAPRRIVLVSVDGLDRDWASRERMPALAALIAREAQARSPATLTFPALTALLSGRTPASTGVTREDAKGFPATGPTLAAELAKLGYRGIALPADPFAHAESGIARGFARFSPSAPAMTDSARADTALAWLARPGLRFAWLGLSFGESRAAWRREDGPAFADAAARAARARELDGAIAHLVKELERTRLAPGTLLALVGTHGLPGDHDPYAVPIALLRVGERSSDTLHGAVDLTDVAPTLVRLAGGRPAGFDGHAVLDRAAPASSSSRPAPSEPLSPCRSEMASLVGDGNALPDSAALTRFQALVQRCPLDRRLAIEEADALSRARREMEAAKRFVAIGERWPADPANAIAYAQHLVRYQRFAVIAKTLAVVPPASPFAAEAAWLSVTGLAGELRFAEAAQAAHQAATLSVPSAVFAAGPAVLDSLREAQRRAEMNPNDPASQIAFGRRLGDYGLMEEAYRRFHQVRLADSTRAEGDFWIGTYLMREGRLVPAAATLERALKSDSSYHVARVALAEALVGLDRWREAIPHLERVVAEDPRDAGSSYNLACLLARDGRSHPALEALRKALAAGYTDWDHLAADPDLGSLRDLPEYRALLATRPASR